MNSASGDTSAPEIVEVPNTEGTLQMTSAIGEISAPEMVEGQNTEGTNFGGTTVFNSLLENSIVRVPERMRRSRVSDFKPKMVSIGPYYHGRDSLRRTETTKRSCMQKLLTEQPVGGIRYDDVPLAQFMAFVENARSFYQEPIPLRFNDNDNFAQMLVNDSCFIISVLLFLSKERQNILPALRSDPLWEDLFISKEGRAVIKVLISDLLLLENQIPLFFIERVYQWFFPNTAEFSPFHTVLEQSICSDRPCQINSDSLSDVAHLLDLYWRCSWSTEISTDENLTGSLEMEHPSLAHATKLQKIAGIKFKKFSNKCHHRGSDVIFSNGIMWMPWLKIDPSQTTVLLNLIASENSKPVSKCTFTSYMKLMSALINSENDVELLQKSGVICNTLCSNKMAVDFFNDIGKLCSLNNDQSLFFNSLSNMEKYYHSGWHRTWATLRQDYFRNTWTGIAVGSGAALLILSAFQTIYTIFGYYYGPRH